MFSYLRKALCLIMLTISSYEDFKTREVDDRIWLIFSPMFKHAVHETHNDHTRYDIKVYLCVVSDTPGIPHKSVDITLIIQKGYRG
jgi:hypothetical protein